MEQDLVHWLPLSLTFVIAGVFLWRHRRPKADRHSCGQRAILLFYRVIRFLWAIVRGVDVGYLEFRKVLASTVIDMENEKVLGRLVKQPPPRFRQELNREFKWAAGEN